MGGGRGDLQKQPSISLYAQQASILKGCCKYDISLHRIKNGVDVSYDPAPHATQNCIRVAPLLHFV
jgi:hypothetical protein